MVHRVALTLLGTGFADLGAGFADHLAKLAATGHVGHGKAADLGTVHVEADAALHRLGIGLRETGNRAVVAGVCTRLASFDTRAEVFV